MSVSHLRPTQGAPRSPLLSELESLLADAKRVEMRFIAETEYKLETRIAALESCNRKLRQQNEVLNRLCQASRDEVARLLAKHEAESEKSQELIAFLRTSFEQARAIAARVPELETRLAEAERQSATSSRELRLMLERNDSLQRTEQARIRTLETQLTRSVEELGGIQQKILEHRQAAEQVYEDLASANARVAWFEETLVEAEGDAESADTLRVKIKYLERRLANAERRLEVTPREEAGPSSVQGTE